MKLYTTPRQLPFALLRKGDHIALSMQDRLPIGHESAYLDAELHDRVLWVAVTDAPKLSSAGLVLVPTSDGPISGRPADSIISRESVHLDPWSYVRSSAHDPAPAAAPVVPSPRGRG